MRFLFLLSGLWIPGYSDPRTFFPESEPKEEAIGTYDLIVRLIASVIFVVAGAGVFVAYPATLLGGKEMIGSAGVNYKFLAWDILFAVIVAAPFSYLAWKEKWEHGLIFTSVVGMLFMLPLGWTLVPALIIRGDLVSGIISGILWIISVAGFYSAYKEM